METQPNYPHPNTPTTMPASTGTLQQTAKSTVGFPEHRGNAPQTGGPNYSGGEGTGIEKPKNHPSSL